MDEKSRYSLSRPITEIELVGLLINSPFKEYFPKFNAWIHKPRHIIYGNTPRNPELDLFDDAKLFIYNVDEFTLPAYLRESITNILDKELEALEKTLYKTKSREKITRLLDNLKGLCEQIEELVLDNASYPGKKVFKNYIIELADNQEKADNDIDISEILLAASSYAGHLANVFKTLYTRLSILFERAQSGIYDKNEETPKYTFRYYEYHKLDGKSYLKELCRALKDSKLIHNETKPADFIEIFSGKPVNNRVVWTGYMNQLNYFARKLNASRKFEIKHHEQNGHLVAVYNSFYKAVNNYSKDKLQSSHMIEGENKN
jgi:hypothetical protein